MKNQLGQRINFRKSAERSTVCAVTRGTDALSTSIDDARPARSAVAGAPPGDIGRSRMMNVFVREQGRWRFAGALDHAVPRAGGDGGALFRSQTRQTGRHRAAMEAHKLLTSIDID